MPGLMLYLGGPLDRRVLPDSGDQEIQVPVIPVEYQEDPLVSVLYRVRCLHGQCCMVQDHLDQEESERLYRAAMT